MIRKAIQRIHLFRKLRFFQYLYLNHFCRNVIRTDSSRILPYKNTIVDLDPFAKIYLGGGDIELGCDRLTGSKAETLVRLRENAVWSCEGGCRISYGATVEVLQAALLDTQYFTMNTGSVIIAAKRIGIGHDVMLGRGVVVYDSDHHAIRNKLGEITNTDAPVTIGDHVWLATNATVLKNSVIGSGSLIGANAVVHGIIAPDTLYQTANTPKSRSHYGTWSREHPKT